MSRRLNHDRLLFVYALAGGAPAVFTVVIALWFTGDYTSRVQWTITLLIGGCWLGFALALRERVIRPLQTIANLLSALREGDFSIRARGAGHDDPLGEAFVEINILSKVLQEQRLGAIEATALLRTVMEEIDVAIFAFDVAGSLRLVNRTGQELLGQPAERILGRSALELGLGETLEGSESRVLTKTEFPGGSGRWGLRRTAFREEGRPHLLVVIADLSQALRAEELKAWQRLVRVLGHELNNSLAPIKSIAGSLSSVLRKTPRAADWEDDMRSGLDVISTRAESLSRFMHAYSRLARLPAPTLGPCDANTLVEHVVKLEQRLPITVRLGPRLTLHADAAQIEQVLINLLKNAVEASLETGGGVRISWSKHGNFAEFQIDDDGPGLANPANLFVPFFTTKPEGSGIGLVLCRQIAENHFGALQLQNRAGGVGCVATLRLPLAPNL